LLFPNLGIFLLIYALIVVAGAPRFWSTAAGGTANQQSFDPDADQRTDEIRNQACADDRQYDDDELVDQRGELRRDFVLKAHDQNRSSGCDRLPDEDAEEQSDDDGRGTSTDRGSPALDVLAAARATGIEQTAEETGSTAQRQHYGVAFLDTAAAVPVCDVSASASCRFYPADVGCVRFNGHLRSNLPAAVAQRVYEEQTADGCHVDHADDPFLLSGSPILRLRQLQQPENDETDESQKHDQRSLSCRREAGFHLRALVDPRLTPVSGMFAVLLEDVVLPLAE